jgi:general secretion pathway protein G
VSGRLLAIVIGVIVLLGAAYTTTVIHREKDAHFARAAALRNELQTMRKAIARFRAERGRYPHTLQELVPHYLPAIPRDPVTGDPWRVDTEESVQPSADFTTSTNAKTETYVIDVHTSATGLDAHGAPYSGY